MPNQNLPSSPIEETVVIVGVGLIGGSIAAALQRRKMAKRIIGVGRDQVRLDAAQRAGLIDEGTTDISTVVTRANLIVFCTPVDHVALGVRAVELALSNSTGHKTSPDLLLTDAGSVKGPICDDLTDVPAFIGSHPIAGSHRQGFEAADPELFEGRICVLTPMPTSSEPLIERLERFWQVLGMQTVRMSPRSHDAALAMTSHLPHVIASALSMTLSGENRALTGSGFRDTTRIAAGDPDLWTGILMNNADRVIGGIDEVRRNLSLYTDALAKRDSAALHKLLAESQSARRSLTERPPSN